MKKPSLYRLPRLILGIALLSASSQASFFSILKKTFSASVVIAGTPPLTINALPLAANVFSGKHFVIPVEVISSGGNIQTSDLQIAVVYQLFDASGNPISGTAPQVVPVDFLRVDPNNPKRIVGTAYIQRDNLTPIQFGGQVKYFFRVLQGAAGVYLGGGTVGTAAYPTSAALSALLVQSGYTASIVTSFDSPVSPDGSVPYVPDTFETVDSGNAVDSASFTRLILGPGAVPNAGTLHIENLNVAAIPAGPGGIKPIVAYNFSLLGTSLQKAAQLVLSYPADLNGQIADNGGNPLSLAPYWWDGVNWRVLGRPQIDTTLHTVTTNLPPPANGSPGQTVVAAAQSNSTFLGLSTQFEGSFALFTAGAATASSLRPMERIITPNGDGKNDFANFSGLVDGEVVHIFDVRGRRVRTINASTNSPTQWDGRNDGGSIVDSGVYIYQYESQGSRVSGVIVVAK